MTDRKFKQRKNTPGKVNRKGKSFSSVLQYNKL